MNKIICKAGVLEITLSNACNIIKKNSILYLINNLCCDKYKHIKNTKAQLSPGFRILNFQKLSVRLFPVKKSIDRLDGGLFVILLVVYANRITAIIWIR